MSVLPLQQIPFDLGHRIALGREDFLVAPCNQDAVNWMDRWPAWPAPALVLQGPAASGKTHLGAVWKNRAQASWIDSADLATGDANDLAGVGHVVVDHFDPWIGDRTVETTLFHLYNVMKDRGTTLLITMRTAPGQIEFALPDLSSRLRAAPIATIHPLDDTLLRALLVKLFADRQLQIGEEVLSYTVPRMERSFASARDVVDRADRLALSEKKAITVSLLRQVLAVQDK